MGPAIARAARRGYGLMLPRTLRPDQVRRVVDDYRAQAPAPGRWGMIQEVWVGGDARAAERHRRRVALHYRRRQAPGSRSATSSGSRRATASPRRPSAPSPRSRPEAPRRWRGRCAGPRRGSRVPGAPAGLRVRRPGRAARAALPDPEEVAPLCEVPARASGRRRPRRPRAPRVGRARSGARRRPRCRSWWRRRLSPLASTKCSSRRRSAGVRRPIEVAEEAAVTGLVAGGGSSS